MVVRGAGVFVCCGCGLVFLASMFCVCTSQHGLLEFLSDLFPERSTGTLT